MRRLGTIAVCCLLTACSTTRSLETLRKAPLTGSEFHMELARHYLDLSEKELAVYDWWSSKYFADKGMMAAYGQDVPPEQLANWDISDNKAKEELHTAYLALVETLTPDLKTREPKRAARLQYAYDCWLEEQEEGWEIDAIAHCRNQFYRELEGKQPAAAVAAPKIQAPKALIEPSTKAKPKAKPQAKKQKPVSTQLSSSYLINFPWDESSVAGMARDELEVIAVGLKANPKMRVMINGHADRSGEDGYNLQLSQKRADFIRDFLVHQGIPNNRIEYYAFGESDPLIPTQDGQKEAANRRVEISIE